MADVNANINIDINSSDALAGLKQLETQINAFQRSVNSANSTALAQQASLNRALRDGINATGMFAAKQVDVVSSSVQFTNALEKNKLTLAEYTRYTASQLPGLSRIFRKEFDTMEQVATSRVRAINTQYLALGKSIDGITRSIAATPDVLEKGYGTQMAVALQRQQMFNKLIDDGSTKLLNWGKNTQWAGRQLMVGLSLPMAAFGAAAASAFMELDKATVQLERVYGDLSTTRQEVEQNTEAIKQLGAEYTKYGIAVSETISIGARAAATGATNETLLAATEQTLRFATLGQIDYNQALDTTISLQTAFAISNDQLAQKIDFLNAVENQTILTIEDMSLAIPRVATVVRGLGGDVEDLAVMMTAMREGGVSAENAANGLKSGLASMINPTNAASETLRGLGINLEGIVSQYRGDLMGTIIAFGTELDKLGSFERQQALEKTFGKYQYARMSALFDNITSKTGQAARAMDLAGYSAEQLATISEKELGTIAESTTVKFQAAIEELKLAIAPLGEAFLKVATPAIEVISKIAEAFNNLPDVIKNAIGVATIAIAGIGPVILMGAGLMGNLVANIIKGIQWWRKLGATIKGNSDQFNYMTRAELDALAANEALEGSTTSLTGKINLQSGAVRALTLEYQRFANAAGIASGAMSAIPLRGAAARSGNSPVKMATGGIVPGSGSGDKIPALLEPGETVVTKKASQKYGPVLAGMNAGTLPGYSEGNTDSIVIPNYRAGERTNTQSIERLIRSAETLLNATVSNEQERERRKAELQEIIDTNLMKTSEVTKKTLVVSEESLKEALKIAGFLPTGPSGVHQTHVRQQAESTFDVSEIRSAFAAGGNPVTEGRLKELLDAIEEINSVAPAIRMGTRTDLTAGLKSSLNYAMKTEGGASEQQFVSEYTESTDRWSNAIARAGVSATEATAQFDLLDSKVIEIVERLGVSVRDADVDLSGGIDSVISYGQVVDMASEELKQAGHDLSLVDATFEKLERSVSNVQISANLTSEVLEQLANDFDVVSIGQGSERSHLFFRKGGQERGEDPLISVRSKAQRESVVGSETNYRKSVSQASRRQTEQLINDASNAIDESLEINSPAERIARAGDDMDEGLAEGIRRSAPIPVAAARNLADQTAEELEKTIEEKTSQLQKLSAEKAAMKATPTLSGTALSEYSQYPLLLEAKMRDLAAQSQEMNDIYTRMTANGASTIQILEAMNQQEMVKRGQLEEQYDAQIRQTRAQIEDARITRQTQIEQEKEIAAKQRELAAQQSQSLNSAMDAATTGAGARGGRLGGFFSGGTAGALGMALGMGSMIPFMAQNEEGKFMGADANAIGMGMAGAGMALEVGPMLLQLAGLGGIAGKVGAALLAFAGPIAIATAAVAAAGVAIYAWRNSVDSAARKAAELGANLGGTSNALNKMAEMLGKETPAQRRAQVQVGALTEKQQESYGQYQSMIDSEAGQELITGLKEATSAERFKILGDYVTSAVASGIMEYDFAEGFVKTVSTQLGDAVMGKNVLSALSEFKDLASNTEGMLSIANKRLEASENSADMQAVLAGGDVSNIQASNAIGQALQGIQDFANTTALAEQEFADGTISYSEYIDALNESTNAQNMYTRAIMFALQNSGDQGGTKQALIDQLTKMGYGDQAEGMVGFMDNAGLAAGAATKIAAADKINAELEAKRKATESERDLAVKSGDLAAIDEANRKLMDIASSFVNVTKDGMVTGGMGVTEASGNTLIADYINNLGREAQDAAQKDAYQVGSNMIAAIVQGMDPATAQKTAEQIVAPIGPAGEAVKKIYDNALQAGADAVTAFEGATVAARELNAQTATKGLYAPGQYAAALGSIGGGTEVAKLDRYMQGLAEEDRQGFSSFLAGNQGRLQGEAGKNFASMSSAAQSSLGAGVAKDIVNTDAWVEAANKGQKASETIIKSVQDIGTAFGDDEEAKKKYIDFALRKDPEDLDVVLPQITDRLNEINEKIPDEIQKLLNIDITNPEEIMGLSEKDISNLQFIGEAIKNLPEERKELAADIAYTVNGEPKDPKTFLADLKKQSVAYEKLKSKNINVKKKAMFDLITLRDGKPADPEVIDQAVKDLEDKFGPGVVKNLPPDQFNKAVTATYDASQLKKQADALDKAAGSLTGVDKQFAMRMRDQAAALRQAAADLEQEAAMAVAAGAGAGAATAADTSGGGGGGDKADPYKDFKQSLVDQIKQFADIEVNMKKLMDKKYNFFNLLKMSNGIDDKIRKAGITGPLADELMSMAPDEANKILNKMTGKGGKLTAEGRKLQDRYMGTQILQTGREQDLAIDSAMAQSRALSNASKVGYFSGAGKNKYGTFAKGGLSSYGIQALTDPKIANQYNFLADKFLQASEKTGKGSVKAWNEAGKALSDYTKKMEKAAMIQQGMAAVIQYDLDKTRAREVSAMAVEARKQNLSQEAIDEIASGSQLDRLIGLKAQRDELREQSKADPSNKALKRRLKEAEDAVKNFYTNFQSDLNQTKIDAAIANPAQALAEGWGDVMNLVDATFEQMKVGLEQVSEMNFESTYGKSKEEAQKLIKVNDALIAKGEEQINIYQRLNNDEQRLIEGHEREKKQWQDKIDAAQEYIDDWQHSIDLLNKDIERRNHQADLLNHELDLMGKAEEDINETYDKRMKALDQVEAVNNRILESQRSQLDISRALSTGDVYAAAAAAQQMRDQQAQQAMTDARDALTTARDNQVEGLRSSSGMTREQIEEQLWQINQQNYQTSLLIYELEDKIWNKNQEIYGLKQEIEKIDNLIKEHTNKIWENNGKILEINGNLDPLRNQNAMWSDRLNTSAKNLESEIASLEVLGHTQGEWENMNKIAKSFYNRLIAQQKVSTNMLDTWKEIAKAISVAQDEARGDTSALENADWAKISTIKIEDFTDDEGTVDLSAARQEIIKRLGERVAQLLGTAPDMSKFFEVEKNYSGGFVSGMGSRDSVPTMLTPGEFVVRKSMVRKYGASMFDKINQGAFDLPRYSVSQPGPTVKPVSVSSMTAPVYNNTYSINVPVNQPNASADEIAYKVMTKIKSIDSASIRRVNGY